MSFLGLPNLLRTRGGRLAAFFFLYVTEGIPLGFTATAIATQMRRQGLSPTQIGAFVGALYLPWAWKWIAGPFVDLIYSRRLGRRRGWILATQVLMSLCVLALMPIDYTAELRLFTGAVLVLNLFSAVQDVAIDALACGVLSESERGTANGLMFAGAYIGQAAGGSGVLLLTDYLDFRYTFLIVAAMVLAVTLLVVLPMREAPPAPGDDPPQGGFADAAREVRRYAIEALRAFFGTRAAIAGLVFALFPAGAHALSLALQSNLSVELGLTDRRIALLTLASTIISAICCVLGGWLSDRFGRRRMLALYILFTAFPTAMLAWSMDRHGWIMPREAALAARNPAPASLVLMFWIANLVYAVFQGLLYGTRTALFMDIVSPRIAATQFTAYMGVLNLVIWYSATWQGFATDRWGYPATLLIDAAFGLIGLLALPWTLRRPMAAEPAPAATAATAR